MARQVHVESVKITIDGEEIPHRPLSDAEFRELIDDEIGPSPFTRTENAPPVLRVDVEAAVAALGVSQQQPVDGYYYVTVPQVNIDLYLGTRRDRVRAKLLIRANNEAKRRERGSSRSKVEV